MANNRQGRALFTMAIGDGNQQAGVASREVVFDSSLVRGVVN